MLTSFKLIDGVGPSQYSGPEDTLTTKWALHTLGLYGRDSLSDTPDFEMFEGLKTEQRRNRIHPDGVMNPDGPTHWMLNADVKARRSGQPVPGSLGLKIGFGLAGTPSGERRQVGQALNTLNLLNRREAEDPYARSSGLRRFQMLVNEKPDGIARPGGRTETKLAKAAFGMSPDSSAPGKTATRKSRPAISATPEAQLASTSRSTGLWNNPTIWAFEQAGKAAKEAGNAAASLLNLDDHRLHREGQANRQEMRWNKHPERGEAMPHFGATYFLVPGAVRVEQSSPTRYSVEGSYYNVDWRPLNPDGTLADLIFDPDGPMSRPHGGHFLPGSNPTKIHRPPYEHKHGWEFRLTVPPQGAANGNSAGVDHNVYLPEGSAQLKRTPFPEEWWEIE